MGHSVPPSERAWSAVPVFPLPEMVLFPGVVVSLHIFEPRYRLLLQDALTTGGSMMVLAHIHPDGGGNEMQPTLYPVATLGKVVEHRALPDGRSNISVQGLHRVEMQEVAFRAPYRRADLMVLHDQGRGLTDAEETSLRSAALAFTRELQKRSSRFTFSLAPTLSGSRLVDECASHLILGPAERQALLEERDVSKRLARTLDMLAAQVVALRGEGVLN